jgi:class 3 adenylate cyclase
MDVPDSRYAKTDDGVYIAYQVIGEGPVDLVWQFDFLGSVDGMWEHSFFGYLYRGLASFSRLILLDRRGTGQSSRNVPPSDLDTRAKDLGVVLEAVDARAPVLGGLGEGGSSNALFAASNPERARSLVWWNPSARARWAPDYPWGVTDAYLERSRHAIEASWGTDAYGAAFEDAEATLQHAVGPTPELGRLSRLTATPDVALVMDQIWAETDLRGVLPSVRAPALLLQLDSADRGEIDYTAGLMPNAEVELIPAQDESQVALSGATIDAIKRFLSLPVEPVGLDRVLATVLFTDIVGSTELATRLGDAAWKQMLAAHDERAQAEIARFGGVYIASTGDGLLATFDGPARAVRCARGIASAVRSIGLEIRAGCHTGEIEREGSDVRGITVHVGARVAALAEAGEVMVSATVKDLTAGSGLEFEDAGEYALKGVTERAHLFRLRS